MYFYCNQQRSSVLAFFGSWVLRFLHSSILTFFDSCVLQFLRRPKVLECMGRMARQVQRSSVLEFFGSWVLLFLRCRTVLRCMERSTQRSSVLAFFDSCVHRFLCSSIHAFSILEIQISAMGAWSALDAERSDLRILHFSIPVCY